MPLAKNIFGQGHRAEQHQQWFTSYTGILPYEDAPAGQVYYSDYFAAVALRQASRSVPLLSGLVGEVGMAAGEGVYKFVPVLVRLWPVWLWLGLYLVYRKTIQRQQDRFKDEWKKHLQKECWGDMSRDNPCGGKAYKELHFSCVKQKMP
mmetsp:Transcript_22269/g.40121  ORF Transcript_22269/g.40121 Transcript_22269/m.40121 type:complete len:149 (-) Transcript_22269:127-573(-)